VASTTTGKATSRGAANTKSTLGRSKKEERERLDFTSQDDSWYSFQLEAKFSELGIWLQMVETRNTWFRCVKLLGRSRWLDVAVDRRLTVNEICCVECVWIELK
jgi:hypothetical protein